MNINVDKFYDTFFTACKLNEDVDRNRIVNMIT